MKFFLSEQSTQSRIIIVKHIKHPEPVLTIIDLQSLESGEAVIRGDEALHHRLCALTRIPHRDHFICIGERTEYRLPHQGLELLQRQDRIDTLRTYGRLLKHGGSRFHGDTDSLSELRDAPHQNQEYGRPTPAGSRY